MVALSVAASVVARSMTGQLHVVHDPRFSFDYSNGMTLPVRIVYNIARGWPFLVLVWSLVGALAICAWQCAKSIAEQGRHATATLIAGQIVVLAALSFFSISFSPDPYAYVLWSRLYGIHGVNPYLLTGPIGALSDPAIEKLLRYYGNPPPSVDYGPLWLLLAGLLAKIEAGAALFWQFWSHRAIAAASAVAATAGILYLLRALPPAERNERAALFAFAPLVLYESAVGGHNDMLLVALGVWAFALAPEFPLFAALLLGAAIAVKFVAVITLPFLVIVAARKRAAAGGLSAIVSLSVVVICFAPFWQGAATLRALQTQSGVMVMSLGWLLGLAASSVAALRGPELQHVVQDVLGGCFLIAAIVAIVRYAFGPCGRWIWLTVTALLWALPALNPWYALWLSPAIAARGRWAAYAWWFGLVVFLHYTLDVIAVPATANGLRTMVNLLTALTIVILALPATIAMLGKPPWQGVDLALHYKSAPS